MSGGILDFEPFARHAAYTLWRLDHHPTDPSKKPIKVPVHYDGKTRHTLGRPARGDLPAIAPNPAPPLTIQAAQEWLAHNRATGIGHDRAGEVGYLGMGFRPEGTGLACLDIDDCLINGQWAPHALTMMKRFPGALFELSTSGTGLHIWFSYQGDSPGRHGKDPTGLYELYGEGQFLAFGQQVLQGDATTDHTVAMHLALAEFWPARTAGNRGVTANDWDTKTDEQKAATKADLLSACRFLAGDNTYDYHRWVNTFGMRLACLGDEGNALWHEVSSWHPQYDPDEAESKWWQLNPSQTGYKALFSDAAKQGWMNPRLGREFAAAAAIAGSAGIPAGEAVPGTDEWPEGSEQGLSEIFARESEGRYRWSPGLDWMVNRGTHWESDEKLSRYNAAKEICKRQAAAADGRIAIRICAASTSHALLNLAQSAPGIATDVREWDSRPMLLNTPGGAIDLTTGQAVSREGLLFKQVAGVAPAAMFTPVWDRFISEIFGGDRDIVEFVQRLGGYTLTGSVKEQKLFFLHGAGANGKSVLLDVLRNIGGSYAHNLPSEALMTSRNEGHPTMLASLQGKRLAISSEIEESAHWAESRIKSLTGDETLTARYMRQNFFTFAISHKHLIAGNFKPRLKGEDYAMVRRMVLVPFTQKFEGSRRDDALPEKLKAEYPGILAWFVDGARKWFTGGLAIPTSVNDAGKAYMAEHNDLEMWIADCCDVAPDQSARSSDLYASFKPWKERNGEVPPSVKSFSQRLERLHRRKKTAAGMLFEGLALKPPFGAPVPRASS